MAQPADPMKHLDQRVADEVMQARMAIEKELGEPICGYFLGNADKDGHWRVCKLPPNHTGLHH